MDRGFDEVIDVRGAEEVDSPVPRPPTSSGRRTISRPDVRSPRASNDIRRYSVQEDPYNKSMGLDSETSDSEDSDDLDAQKSSRIKPADLYDPKQFDDLQVSSEVKELFQNISRYAPQRIDLQYRLIPFIPDYIPAVGDIDAFLKVPRPDAVPERIGLVVLDEPAAEQSEPAVLHLQLRSRSRSAATASKGSVVKRVEDASRQARAIDKWIEDMGKLQRSRPPTEVQLLNRYPHPDVLLQPWPRETESKLKLGSREAGLLNLINGNDGTDRSDPDSDLSLGETVDLLCALLDVPVYGGNRIEALHIVFALFTEIQNIDIQKIHA
ncbi:hypothetical protein QAD02_006086 [Eretmocerus hayati]|uniref:Uncharacterized protein n=1 Tax=Eretmocerus hayati TaxID=131215 RepID=A0ACC2N0B0_9HYME|nr:hypothetical protein QAD02_006086 [Eretmocerus hayati]